MEALAAIPATRCHLDTGQWTQRHQTLNKDVLKETSARSRVLRKGGVLLVFYSLSTGRTQLTQMMENVEIGIGHFHGCKQAPAQSTDVLNCL